MGYPAQIVFSRHAQTEANAIATLEDRTKLEKGTQHMEITDLGHRQRTAMGAWLRQAFPQPFDAYYVSSYHRTRVTLAGYWPDASPIECSLADEANFGIRHYTSLEKIQEDFPHEHRRQSLEGMYHYRPIGGENWPDVELRVRMFLAELSRLHANKRIFICGHAAWYSAFRRVVEGLTKEEMFDRKVNWWINNCSIRIFDGVSDRWYAPWNRTHLIPTGGWDISNDLIPTPHTPARRTNR